MTITPEEAAAEEARAQLWRGSAIPASAIPSSALAFTRRGPGGHPSAPGPVEPGYQLVGRAG